MAKSTYVIIILLGCILTTLWGWRWDAAVAQQETWVESYVDNHADVLVERVNEVYNDGCVVGVQFVASDGAHIAYVTKRC